MATYVGGLKAAEWREKERAMLDATETLTRCSFCSDWEYTGSALEGRETALEHRKRAHPEINPKRRRPSSNLKAFHTPKMSKADLAEIEGERQSRAKINGVDLSAEIV